MFACAALHRQCDYSYVYFWFTTHFTLSPPVPHVLHQDKGIEVTIN